MAFRTISNAVAKASGGDTIWVSNGTYAVTAQITVNKGLTVRSTNGAAVTTVAASGGTHSIFRLEHASAVLEGLTVTNGYAASGAGIYLVNGTLRDCVITKNKTWGNANASSYGSGIYQTGGLVERCTISSNWTGAASGYGGLGFGGGIYMTGGIIRQCRIFGNSTESSYSYQNGRGGGIYIAAPGGTVENTLIYRNKGLGYGGGIAMVGSSARVLNCTISANLSWNNTGAGLYISAGAVTNTIIYHNTRQLDGYHINVNKTGGSVGYSCSTPLVAGTSNFVAEPDFVSLVADDFHLRPGSSCLDAGTNLTTITTDYDNTARPLDGDAVGTARHDVGAYEEAAPASRPFTANFTAPVQDGVDTLTVVFTATASGDTNGIFYRWDYTNDGTNDVAGSTRQTVTNVYGPGYHTVSLVISNGAGTVTNVIKTAYVRVLGSTNYVSSLGAHVFPYVTWANASTSLYAAVNAAIDGGVVLVTNGAYAASNVQLSRGIRLRSVNGAAATSIRGGNRILIAHANAVLEYCTVTRGEGIYMTAGTVRHSTIVSNYFYGAAGGGGILMDAGSLYDCVIRNNTNWGTANSTTYGGGVRMLSGLVSNCTIVNNWAGASPSYGGIGRGGGVYMSGGKLVNCTIVSNTTRSSYLWEYGDGGGVWISGGQAVNCLVAKNAGPGNAGGILLSGSGRLLNCTIAGNTTRVNPGGGLVMTGGSVTNTLVYLNTRTSDGTVANVAKTGGTFAYSCTTPPEAGAANISDDPVFSDTGNLDYRLAAGSSCIDAGTNCLEMTIDLVYTNRPIDGNNDGTNRVDIGAYEASEPADRPFECSFSAPTNTGVDSIDVVFTASVAGNTNGLYYRWDFTNDGTNDAVGSTRRTVTNTYTPGYYSVKLTVSNQVGEVTNFLRTDYVQVLGSVVYASPAGGHTFPFVSWATAATNLQDAVNAAPASGTVLASNGVFILRNKLIVGKGILIQGMNNAVDTIIKGDYRIELNHSNVRFEKLTVRETKGISMTAGTVRDCILETNYLYSTEGGAGIRMTGGLIERCILRHNRTYGNMNAWSYGGGLYLTGGHVRNCLIVANEATTNPGYGGASRGGGVYLSGSALLENCTIAGNSVNVAASAGAGVYRAGGTVTNTIIWDNTNVTTTANSDIGGTFPAGFAWSCSPGLSSGTGNITVDPLFMTAGVGHGYAGTLGDYHLQPASPCKDAGLNMPWMTDAVDLDGKQRRYKTVAMGAYEESARPGMLIMIR